MSTAEAVEVVMPQMGVSVSEGTITKWLKQEGEQIEADEPLLEISTDKVDTEVPSPGSGIVTQILVPEGETVEVGTKLAVIGGEAGAPAEAPPEPATAEAAAEAQAPSGAESPAPAPAPAPAREPAWGPRDEEGHPGVRRVRRRGRTRNGGSSGSRPRGSRPRGSRPRSGSS